MAVSAFGQPQPINRRAVAIAGLANRFTPASIAGLAYWWVATDIPWTNGIATNWIDRIQLSTWTNGAAAERPTNSPVGLAFAGAWQLTNTQITLTAPVATFCIIEKTTDAQCGKYLADYITTHRGFLLGANTCTGTFGWVASFGSVIQLAGPVATNSFMTLITSDSGGTWTYYTNGVNASASANLGAPLISVLGSDGQGNFFKGYIKELAIYTNTLTSGNAVSLNSYATNTYGYTP